MSDQGLLRGIITVISLLTFLGICWWAYRPGNRRRFDADALLAFDDQEIEALSEDRDDLRREKGDSERREGGRA